MTIAELMQNYTPSPGYEGYVTNDDFVMAMDCSETGDAEIADFAVVQMGITGLDAQMNPVTQDKQYVRAGQSSTKTGTQRSFKVGGDRYIGDEFQDFALSHKIKYGTGNTVARPYVYFNVLNGQGEQGRASIIVNSDASGSAGESAGIDIDIKKIGAAPTEYTYTPATP